MLLIVYGCVCLCALVRVVVYVFINMFTFCWLLPSFILLPHSLPLLPRSFLFYVTLVFLLLNFSNRSTDLDKWKPHEIKAMEAGGNAKAKTFFRDHGVFDMEKIESKYHTSASQQYKNKIKEQVSGTKKG